MPVKESLVRSFPALAIQVCLYYFVADVLTYQLLIKRKFPLLCGVAVTCTVLLMAFFRVRFMNDLPFDPEDRLLDALRGQSFSDSDGIEMLRIKQRYSVIIASVVLYCVIAIFAVLLRMYRHKNAKEIENREKLQRSQEAQITYLKSQVNPHFLFNTLNNLYGLTYSKSDLAPHVVLGLSESMRYLIYETEQKLVTLAKELQFIQNYLKLEKTRLPESAQVQCSMQVSHESLFIPPLLLLPFIENCFKHGAVGKHEGGWVEIDIWDEKDTLFFVCKNNIGLNLVSGRSHGIGLANVKKRLDLIYEGKYGFRQEQTEQEYMVALNLPLFKNRNEL